MSFPCPYCGGALAAGPPTCPACGGALVFAGRYLLTALLGRGGMGAVYEGRDDPSGARVAVKILGLGDAKEWSSVDMFDYSARVVQGLQHPGLPRVFALEQDDRGRHILVREPFDGGTLEERVLRDGQRLDPLGFLAGQVTLVLTIARTGQVSKVEVSGSTLGDRAVEVCMVRVVTRWRFAARSEEVTVSQPYNFAPAP
ncbi:MAG TPA: AgmX/PglI C-terminal domain-containing protein [Polyangia bacterium]|jgi:TonB family protein